ncbi:hypothetical protein JX266_008082 [Neoarthrinium moseri]|nr:hypothetical protein JX266_008082 [Neoarthrinium moseri]
MARLGQIVWWSATRTSGLWVPGALARAQNSQGQPTPASSTKVWTLAGRSSVHFGLRLMVPVQEGRPHLPSGGMQHGPGCGDGEYFGRIEALGSSVVLGSSRGAGPLNCQSNTDLGKVQTLAGGEGFDKQPPGAPWLMGRRSCLSAREHPCPQQQRRPCCNSTITLMVLGLGCTCTKTSRTTISLPPPSKPAAFPGSCWRPQGSERELCCKSAVTDERPFASIMSQQDKTVASSTNGAPSAGASSEADLAQAFRDLAKPGRDGVSWVLSPSQHIRIADHTSSLRCAKRGTLPPRDMAVRNWPAFLELTVMDGGEQAASAMEANLSKLEDRLDALLAQFEEIDGSSSSPKHQKDDANAKQDEKRA